MIILEEVGMSIFGSLELFALFITIACFLLLVIAGIDFRISMFIIAPMILEFGSSGWFPLWVSGLAWLMIIGLGMYLVINYFRTDR